MNVIVQGPALVTKVKKFLRAQKYTVSISSVTEDKSFKITIDRPGFWGWFRSAIVTIKYETTYDSHKLTAECHRDNLETAKEVISILEKFISEVTGVTLIAELTTFRPE